jgi:hypothetical protein
MQNELIIELDRVSVRREFLVPLREEFEAGGMGRGRFAIGDVVASPDMIYFLWHDSGEAPVSMLLRRDEFHTENGTRTAARDFLAKWSKRNG